MEWMLLARAVAFAALALSPVACLAIADVGDLVVVEGAGAGGGAGGVGTGGYSCATPAECPDVPLVCEAWTCPAGTCELANASEGSSCSDNGGQVCDARGNCVECVADGQCSADQYCDSSTNVCEAKKASGESCTRDAECLSGNCNGMNHTCS